jgi:GTP-binding protein
MGMRRGQLLNMHGMGTGRVTAEFRVPTRGLLGFRGAMLTATRGTAVMSAIVDGYEPWAGELTKRRTGVLIADRPGRTTPYAIFHLQPRGTFFVPHGIEVFSGQVVGENAKDKDLYINVVREKKLTNIRAAGRDENVILTPPRDLTLEIALEFINPDEIVEVTPAAIRLAKRAPDKSRFASGE